MGSVTGLTAERMLAIEAESVVSGVVNSSGHLILTTHDGTKIDAGLVNQSSVMSVLDTTTVDMTLTGSGVPNDPWVISGKVLGLVPTFVADWNVLPINVGPIYSDPTTINNPPVVASSLYMAGHVERYGAAGWVQYAYSIIGLFQGGMAIWTRYYNGSVWGSWSIQGAGRGSSAARDAIFGVPAVDADRVLLANQKITWFNTDNGWEESYYATTATVGLTAPGLEVGVPHGWYPTGANGGPYCQLQPTAAFSATSSNYIGGWNGKTRRKGGNAWFVPAATYIEVEVPGRYEYWGWTTQQFGTGVAYYELRVLNTLATAFLNGSRGGAGQALQASPSYTVVELKTEEVNTGPHRLYFLCNSGSLSVHQQGTTNAQRGMLSVRYLGPALVTD